MSSNTLILKGTCKEVADACAMLSMRYYGWKIGDWMKYMESQNEEN